MAATTVYVATDGINADGCGDINKPFKTRGIVLLREGRRAGNEDNRMIGELP
jgi:hypothetical protein